MGISYTWPIKKKYSKFNTSQDKFQLFFFNTVSKIFDKAPLYAVSSLIKPFHIGSFCTNNRKGCSKLSMYNEHFVHSAQFSMYLCNHVQISLYIYIYMSFITELTIYKKQN